MPKFSQEDFDNTENRQRLTLVVMKKMGKAPMTAYYSLSMQSQKKFNRIMNEYINEMGENWETLLVNDFNEIVCDEILNENFNPEKQYVPEMGGFETLITDEQRTALEKFEAESKEEELLRKEKFEILRNEEDEKKEQEILSNLML
jgi:hypothetical protein